MRKAPVVATFSIAAADPAAGEVGVAVASRFLAVGSVVPWVRAGVGAVATQAMANVAYGPRGLGLLAQGVAPDEAIEELTAADAGRALRQVGLVDASGRSATYTGPGCLEWAGGRSGRDYACQGNILAGPDVVDALATAFEETDGPLPDRLMAALAAGDAAGGDRRGRQSAALYVAREGAGYLGMNDRFIDLRVDDHQMPIVELRRLIGVHRSLYAESGRGAGIALDEGLRAELRERLGRLDDAAIAAGDAALGSALERFARREGLEGRVRDDGRVDPIVLEVLRART
jgi:uncharacterized Ntn-hydrolase superfamily protein